MGSERAGREEKQIPAAHDDAIIQRPVRLRRRRPVADRSERREPGPDRRHVVPGEFGEVGVGEGGIVSRTVRRDPPVRRWCQITCLLAS